MIRKLGLLAAIWAGLGGLAVHADDTASGSVVTLTRDKIVIDTGDGSQTFLLTTETTVQKGVEKGAQVTVSYHLDDDGNAVADRIHVIARTQPASN